MVRPYSRQNFWELVFAVLIAFTNILIISSISCRREENNFSGIISLAINISIQYSRGEAQLSEVNSIKLIQYSNNFITN